MKWRGEYPGRRCCGVIGAVFRRQVICRKTYVQIKVDEGEEEAYHCVVMYLIAKKRWKRMEQQCREIGYLFFKERVFDGVRERRAEWREKWEEGRGEGRGERRDERFESREEKRERSEGWGERREERGERWEVRGERREERGDGERRSYLACHLGIRYV
jgi:hypothetical protein